MTITISALRAPRWAWRRAAVAVIALSSALTVAMPSSAWAAPFAGGDFEEPALPQIPGVHGRNFHAGEHIGPWLVESGDCDLATAAGSWPAASGVQSIDLNGFGPCSLAQTFDTVLGQDYVVRFAMAGNAAAHFGPKTMMVKVGSEHHTFVFDTGVYDELSPEQVGWARHELRFTATSNQTTLRFTSTTPRSWHGPAIDDVQVFPAEAA